MKLHNEEQTKENNQKNQRHDKKDELLTNLNVDQTEHIIQKRSSNKHNKISEIHYKNGKFYGSFLDNYEFLSEGSESTVYKSKDGSHVIKISEPYGSQEESLYNNRIQETLLGNTLFGNLDLEVIGYYEHNGIKNPIYKQTYIKGTHISNNEAKEYLKSLGALEINNEIYYRYKNEAYKISSDFDENYIKDQNGKIYAIDVSMFKPRDLPNIIFDDTNIQTENPLDNSYNAIHIAKTGRKAISHGANRIPAFGAGKVGVESLIGRTAGGEKLSPVQRKLYGLAATLSSITYGSIALSAYTGNLKLLILGPICSFIASAATAAGQASIAGETDAGIIFKNKLLEYLEVMQKKIGIYTNLQTEQIKKNIQTMSTEEANDMVSEIIKDDTSTTYANIEKNIQNYAQRQPVNIFALNEQLPENDQNGEPYIYRGMYNIDIQTAHNIMQHEGLRVDKLEEGEDICFTSGKAFNTGAIKYATGGDKDLSIIIQIPRVEFKKNNIGSSGASDKVTVDQDIPANILQTGSIFVINYAKQRLEKIIF